MKGGAVVVYSGGLDSVCAAAVLGETHDLYGISFAYGQRARREVQAAGRFAEMLGMLEHRTVDMGFMRDLYGSSNVLTDDAVGVPGSFDYSIVVPVRNGVFLSVAAAWAYSLGAGLVAYGAHAGDGPYPDCRPDFARAMEAAMNLGEEDGINAGVRRPIRVWSPYMDGTTKAQLLLAGRAVLGDALRDTWSCYLDGDAHCGVCESCVNRRAAFREARVPDATVYGR